MNAADGATRRAADGDRAPAWHAGDCPLRVVELDITEPLPHVAAIAGGRRHGGARLLVRLGRQPIGLADVELGSTGASATEVGEAIWRQLGEVLDRWLGERGYASVPGLSATGLALAAGEPGEATTEFEPATPISVVIPTAGRPERLQRCVDSVLAADRGDGEIIVVDNAPREPGTEALLRDRYADEAGVRRVAEWRPGVGRARQAGLECARNEFVVFLDDDVVVDSEWSSAIARAFQSDEQVAAVTTLILPSCLDTPAQLWLEQFGGFSKGFTRQAFDLDRNRPNDPLYPYSPGIYGSGASMAFRTQPLRELGGFDFRLATGGEDLDLFLKVLLAGYRLVYEPAALAWHDHPGEYKGLRRTVFRYGVGLTGLITKWCVQDPAIARDVGRRLPSAARLALDPHSRKNVAKQSDFPSELTWLERAGMLAGPIAFGLTAWKERDRGG